MRRFFYNATSGQCEMFTYGGCGGNDNNFRTVADCRATCSGKADTQVKCSQSQTIEKLIDAKTLISYFVQVSVCVCVWLCS